MPLAGENIFPSSAFSLSCIYCTYAKEITQSTSRIPRKIAFSAFFLVTDTFLVTLLPPNPLVNTCYECVEAYLINETHR